MIPEPLRRPRGWIPRTNGGRGPARRRCSSCELLASKGRSRAPTSAVGSLNNGVNFEGFYKEVNGIVGGFLVRGFGRLLCWMVTGFVDIGVDQVVLSVAIGRVRGGLLLRGGMATNVVGGEGGYFGRRALGAPGRRGCQRGLV